MLHPISIKEFVPRTYRNSFFVIEHVDSLLYNWKEDDSIQKNKITFIGTKLWLNINFHQSQGNVYKLKHTCKLKYERKFICPIIVKQMGLNLDNTIVRYWRGKGKFVAR